LELQFFLEVRGETDGAALGYSRLRVQQLSDRRQDGADSAIVLGDGVRQVFDFVAAAAVRGYGEFFRAN